MVTMPYGMLWMNDECRRGTARAGAGAGGLRGRATEEAVHLAEPDRARAPRCLHRGGRLSALLRLGDLDPGHPGGGPAPAAALPLLAPARELRSGVEQGAHGPDALQQL